MAANGGTAADPQQQLNGLLAKDAEKQNVAIHTFDPDASPEQKAASAGKGRDKLKSVADKGDAPGGKEVLVSTGKAPAIPPTITITDADKDPHPTGVPPESLPPGNKAVPGALPEGPAPQIPDWYKVGWRAVGGIDDPITEGEERDKAVLEQFLSEQLYGAWWHNAAIIFFAVAASHFLTLFRFGWSALFIVLALCATYYTTSMSRVRRRARDDIQRELVKTKMVSEHESAEWINSFLDRFWLIYEPVLSQTVIQSVDQILSANTPPGIDSLRLSTFTLGTKAPRIDKVRTWPRTEEDIVIMDWGFSFTPSDISDITLREAAKKVNPKIVLNVRVGKGFVGAGMPILIEDINFSADIRVRLKLMTTFPHVQTLDVSFLQPPVFDYVLKPIGGEHFGFDIGYIPGLSTFIRDMVHSTLGPMMYDPNVFTLNLEQMLSGAPIDTAIGVLQVTIHSARGIKASKIGGGAPDPYVSLSINQRAELARTKHKDSTYNPTWGETKFLLVNSLTEQLVLTVLDFNEHRKDTDLGAVSFELAKLNEDATLENLEEKILKDGKERGELRFDLSFYPVLKPQKIDGGKEEELPDTKVGIVRLTLHQAKDLDSSKSMSGDLNPFAKILTSANTPPIHTTQRFKHTNNPVWESSTEYLCSDKHSSVVTVKIIDDRDFLKDPMVGYLSIKLDDLLEAKKTVGRDWWPLSGCKTGKVRMSAEWKPLNMAGSLHGADQYVPPIGVVRLWVQKAMDVKNVEAALGGKSDPYLRVVVNNVTMSRTEVINNNLNPEWDQIIYIPVHSLRETMLLECMDYQHLTKDRSLGSVELKVSELANRVDDPKYPYASTGKKTAADPLRLDRGHQLKGTLHYVAEFVPALALKNVHFESSSNEIQKVVEQGDGESDTTSMSSSDVEREAVPVGVTVRKPLDEDKQYEPLKEDGEGDKKEPKPRKSTDTTSSGKTTDSKKTSGTGKSSETAPTAPPATPGVELTKEELLQHQAGVIVFNVRQGQLAEKARLEVLLDDGYWPAFSTVRARSTHAQWDHVGEGFIKELDFGRVWLRLNKNDEGDKDDVVSEFKGDARTFLDQALSGPTQFRLTDQNGERESVVEIEARYVPVDIKLEPRESINNQGTLRVDLINGKEIRGVDRGGKSDPYVVFALNDQKVFKSQTKKKTLTPEWNESFTVLVPSRVAADFSLEVFDWNQIEQAKSLGEGKIDLADLEPITATERTIKLSHQKHGESGEIRIRLLFTPEIIARTRKSTSTFSTAGRAVTQIGAIPLGAGKGVVHGVGKVGQTVGGVFRRDHAKTDSENSQTVSASSEPRAAGQISAPVGSTSNTVNGTQFPSHPTTLDEGEAVGPSEPGSLKVTVLSAKDLMMPDGDLPKPYVVVKVGDKEHKTKHVGKGVNAEWNESYNFAAGPSTTKLYVKVLDHKTLGKDKTLGEADVDIWRHVQPRGDISSADVLVELREGQGLLNLRLDFDASGLTRIGSVGTLNRSPFGSPSRFSLSRRNNSDD